MIRLHVSGGEAAKHFLSGDYIRDPREKERAFGHNNKLKPKASGNQSSSSTTMATRTERKSDNPFDNMTLNSFDPERIRR